MVIYVVSLNMEIVPGLSSSLLPSSPCLVILYSIFSEMWIMTRATSNIQDKGIVQVYIKDLRFSFYHLCCINIFSGSGIRQIGCTRITLIDTTVFWQKQKWSCFSWPHIFGYKYTYMQMLHEFSRAAKRVLCQENKTHTSHRTSIPGWEILLL